VKQELLVLFESFRKRPDDPESLSEALISCHHEYCVKRSSFLLEPTPAKYKDQIKKYLKVLERVRSAYFLLDPKLRDFLATTMCFTDSSFFSDELLRKLSADIFVGPHYLKDWRRKELARQDMWNADIEMIDLLIATAKLWQERHSPDAYKRGHPEMQFILQAKGICEAHGLHAGSSEHSPVVRLVGRCLYTNDPRKLGRAARKRGAQI
jgi:hypothetical protein